MTAPMPVPCPCCGHVPQQNTRERQIFGGSFMVLSAVLGIVFLWPDKKLDLIEASVCALFLGSGGIIFDTRAFIAFAKAIPLPFKRNGGGDDGSA